MKKLDIYKGLKIKYPKFVILIRVGNFYEVYGEEAYIFHNLFNYKIVKIATSIRVGFPVIAYNKVIEKLHAYKISYLIVENEKEIKHKFNRNNYDNYLSKDLSIEDRIFKINERLTMLKNSPKIQKILNQIEDII